ncbi:MAG: ATP-binding cassette domain-containing protein [Gammaproteobacteria bacterium]|nr:ATP-binding cassette domain-containing protein [Gammaproteobacteria bacterium]
MLAESENLVEIRDLRYSISGRVICDGMNINIRRGQVTAIMGPSGCGKTTVLRLLGGQIKPQSGQVLFNGKNIPTMSKDELYAVRRRMGMMFQSGALFTDLSVFENVAFPLREHTRLPEALLRSLVLMKLEAVGLRGARDLVPSELSGGMARRVALARAIALDPDMIMYDEPFVGLDPISQGVIVQLIRLLNDALKLTSVIVSHDIQEVMSIADYIYLIANGQVIGEGTPEQVKREHSPRVVQFMRGEPDGPVPFHYPAQDYTRDLLGDRA